MLREREALIQDLFEDQTAAQEISVSSSKQAEAEAEAIRRIELSMRREAPQHRPRGIHKPGDQSKKSNNEKFPTKEELRDKACKLRQDEYKKIITQDLPIFARNEKIKELNNKIKDEGCQPFPLIQEPKQEQPKQDDKKPEIKQPNPNSGKWCEKDKIMKYPTSKCKTGWATIKGTCVPPPVN